MEIEQSLDLIAVDKAAIIGKLKVGAYVEARQIISAGFIQASQLSKSDVAEAARQIYAWLDAEVEKTLPLLKITDISKEEWLLKAKIYALLADGLDRLQEWEKKNQDDRNILNRELQSKNKDFLKANSDFSFLLKQQQHLEILFEAIEEFIALAPEAMQNAKLAEATKEKFIALLIAGDRQAINSFVISIKRPFIFMADRFTFLGKKMGPYGTARIIIIGGGSARIKALLEACRESLLTACKFHELLTNHAARLDMTSLQQEITVTEEVLKKIRAEVEKIRNNIAFHTDKVPKTSEIRSLCYQGAAQVKNITQQFLKSTPDHTRPAFQETALGFLCESDLGMTNIYSLQEIKQGLASWEQSNNMLMQLVLLD
ncbi:MAG: hypothetical protein ACOYK8_03695 [Alphaproteobacteria bacterium]